MVRGSLLTTVMDPECAVRPDGDKIGEGLTD